MVGASLTTTGPRSKWEPQDPIVQQWQRKFSEITVMHVESMKL